MLHFSRDDESSHKLGSNSDHFSVKTDGGGRGHWINASIGQQLRSDCWLLLTGPVYVPANIRRSINLPQLSITLNTMFIELFDHKYWDKMYFIERFKGAKGAAFRKQRINGEYCNKRRIKWVYVLVYSSYETLLWWRIQNRKHLHSKPKRSTSSPSRKTL